MTQWQARLLESDGSWYKLASVILGAVCVSTVSMVHKATFVALLPTQSFYTSGMLFFAVK